MAYQTGTASDPQDFYDKLETFLTTHADLVLDGVEWTKVWSHATDDAKVFRATGAAGTDSIYVGMRLVTNVGLDQAYFELVGMTGYINSATNLWGHVNVTPSSVRIYLDFSPFTYWWTANGRRMALAHKVSTVYQSAYAGFMLPVVLPTQYPDPVVIGGMSWGHRNSDALENTIKDWRGTDRGHSAFWDASRRDQGGVKDGSCWLLDPSYNWKQVVNWNQFGSDEVYTHPYRVGLNSRYSYLNANGQAVFIERLSEFFGGDEGVTQVTLCHETDPITYGVFDGVYHVKGIRQNAESIITVDGVDYLVLQNAFRTGRKDYAALRLE